MCTILSGFRVCILTKKYGLLWHTICSFKKSLCCAQYFSLSSAVYKDILLSNCIKFHNAELLPLRKLKRANTPGSIIIVSSMERAI